MEDDNNEQRLEGIINGEGQPNDDTVEYDAKLEDSDADELGENLARTSFRHLLG